MNEELSHDDLLELLAEVGQELTKRGKTASIYVVGGAAMSLEYDSRRLTRDVDAAVSGDKSDLWDVAKTVGERHGLSPHWLNTNAVGFISNEPDIEAKQVSVPGLNIGVASPDHLIAMKLRSLRSRDIDDLIVLFRDRQITDPAQAAEIHNRLFSDSDIGYSDPDEPLYAAQRVFAQAEANGEPLSESGIHVPPLSENKPKDTYVHPHLRNGKPVRGHSRKRNRS